MLATQECPLCEDGKVWASKYGGNDPDVWAVKCEACDGTGVVEIDLNDFADEDE
jgi:excinuclease UvrABC ATPase subunit